MEKNITFHLAGVFLDEYMKLKDGYGITSAIVYVGEMSLGETYDKEHDNIHSRNIKVYTDMTVKLDTKWKTYNVNLVVRIPSRNELHEFKHIAEYNTETDSVDLSIDLPTVLKENEIYHSAFSPEPPKNGTPPTITLDEESGKLNVSNIKYDLTLNYFVKVPESN
jgi:hypothetical protein